MTEIQNRPVLLSGASGMLGTALGSALAQQGAHLQRLVRRPPENRAELQWNPQSANGDLNAGRLEGLQAVIHLSGANVAAGRWTGAYKRELRESRVTTTRVLAEALARLKAPPTVMLVASAVGYFGNRGAEVLDEDSRQGSGFFPELCAEWEAASRPAEQAGIRIVHLRFGVVIGKGGGIVAKLSPMFHLGLGGPLGNGRQWMSWVSATDAVRASLFVLKNAAMRGPVNVVSPIPVTNGEFTREFGKAVHMPALLPAPEFALKLAFGQMAEEALLASTRVIPKRLQAAGFGFVHPDIRDALEAGLAK